MGAYGPQGIPAGKVSGPGWPRRTASAGVGADTAGLPARVIILRSDQDVRIPDWATFARISATGRGGKGTVSSSGAGGGGGGGFSGTNIEKAAPGALISARFDSTAVTVDGLGYRLTAGNGATVGSLAGGAGGIGSGGAVNFNGGAGGTASINSTNGGGGAASRGGNGGDGAIGGGSGGARIGYFSGGATGGSANGSTLTASISTPPALIGAFAIYVATPQTANSDGADGGGGSGGVGSSSTSNNPGNGLVVIEFW